MYINTEKLTYWYFRLNGFLTIENFVVHPRDGHKERTEIDLIAVRFPNRSELYPGKSMQDDDCLKIGSGKIRIILSEATTHRCKLNEALIKPENQNIERVLWALGAFECDKVYDVSKKLYGQTWYEDDEFAVSLCALGKRNNPDLFKMFPEMLQMTWRGVLSFIHRRFSDYKESKREHPQWGKIGNGLWDCFKNLKNHSDVNEFIRSIRIVPEPEIKKLYSLCPL